MILPWIAPPDKRKDFYIMNYDEVKVVLFPVLEEMGYTLDLDDEFDLQPAVVTFDRKRKKMCIDPKADSLNQVIGALSMYFERFPACCERAIYFQNGRTPPDRKDYLPDLGYVRLSDYNLKEYIRFIMAIMIAAQQKVR